MKQNKIVSDREPKNIVKSYRTTQTQNKMIKESPLSVYELIELAFLVSRDDDFNKILKVQEMETELKMLNYERIEYENKLHSINDRIINLELELEDIRNTISDKEFSLAKKQKERVIESSIQITLDYYKDYFNPNNNEILSFDMFLTTKESYIKKQATRCGLEYEEFADKLSKAYEESQVQEVLI